MSAEINSLEFKTDEMKQWLLEALRVSVVDITFTKVDGSIRLMKSTLNPELLPKIEIIPLAEGEEPPVPKAPRKENPSVFRVFDTEINEFRTVTWDKITNIVVQV